MSHARPQPLTGPQRDLTTELAKLLERMLEGTSLQAEQALAVLCSMAANLISLEPSLAQQELVRQAFNAGLSGEVQRLRLLRLANDPRYRAKSR